MKDWDAFDRYLFGVPRLVYWQGIGRVDPDAWFQWEDMLRNLAADPKLSRTVAKEILKPIPKELVLIWHRDNDYFLEEGRRG